MKRQLVLLVAVAAIVLTGALARHFTPDSAACTLINAYDVDGSLCVDSYIHIDGSCSGPSPSQQVCHNETLTTCYAVKVGTTCGGTNGACSPSVTDARVMGNNLSGDYRISTKTNNCLELCACTP